MLARTQSAGTLELSQSEGSDGGDDCDGFGTANKKLSEKAIELRRRVEERRTERKAALVKAGEMVLYNQKRAVARTLEKHAKRQGEERLWGAEALGDHMQLYARADQQFAIREGGDHLARDLRRSIVGAREHRDKLKHLEDRVRKMRDDVNGTLRSHADAEVDKMTKDARDDAKMLGLKDLFATCDKCRSRVLRAQLAGHLLVCAGAPLEAEGSSEDEAVYDPKVERIACVVCGSLKTKEKLRGHVERCKVRRKYQSDRKQAKKSVAMKPQPPRDLRIGKITPTQIELKWAPPILDGGATVYEYEVVFSITKVTQIGKKVTKTVSQLPPILTSCFAYVEPVADRAGNNQRAGTSQANFKILSLGQIEVDSGDSWTNRLVSASSRSRAEKLASKRSRKRTLKSA